MIHGTTCLGFAIVVVSFAISLAGADVSAKSAAAGMSTAAEALALESDRLAWLIEFSNDKSPWPRPFNTPGS